MGATKCCAPLIDTFLGGVPERVPHLYRWLFLMCVCVMLPKIASYLVEYSTLQTSTEAGLVQLVEYKELSMCTLSVQYCSAWP